jgi:carboxylesterase
MRWMGEYLAAQGYSVLGVRLMAHGTRPEDMVRARWRDWLAGVEDGWHLLRGMADKVFLVGLSMGGALSLSLAAEFPVAGVVAMSTPYQLPPDPRLPYARLLSIFSPYIKKGPQTAREPEVYRWHVSYPVNPSRAVLELRDLLAYMRASLSKVSAPVLLIHSQADQAVLPENMELIFQQLGSQDKRKVLVENSLHTITLEPEREMIYRQAADFIEEILSQEMTPKPGSERPWELREEG